MMKFGKIIGVTGCLIGIMLVTSCKGNDAGAAKSPAVNNPNSVENVINQQISIEDGVQDKPEDTAVTQETVTQETEIQDVKRQSGLNDNAPAPEPVETASQSQPSEEGIDVDLTVLSATMVYSEVYNMMVSPEAYMGKTVKMSGQYVPFYDDTTDKYYFACIIKDATACCAQGIEFELTDEYAYPDDYPTEGNEICVVGVFDTYEEGETKYCTLRKAKIV